MVKCDGCGSDREVRRAFVTVWNGNILDLCKTCQAPLVQLIDSIFFETADAQARAGRR